MKGGGSGNEALQQIRDDFDEIALLEKQGVWTHNTLYQKLIIREIPPFVERVLEVGCGTGGLCRRLAENSNDVIGVDLSGNMVEMARQLSKDYSNLSYIHKDYFDIEFGDDCFDRIVSVATTHHFSLARFLEKAKRELKPGGRLIIVDLFRPATLAEKLAGLVALPASLVLSLWHNRMPVHPIEERSAWRKHGEHEILPGLAEIREVIGMALPGATLKRLLFWRFSLVWEKPCTQGPDAIP